MKPSEEQRATLYAVWLCVLAEAADRNSPIPGVEHPDHRESIAIGWLDLYERRGIRPDPAAVDELAAAKMAEIWSE